jgi:dolichol-phosphate mannosyltransferase
MANLTILLPALDEVGALPELVAEIPLEELERDGLNTRIVLMDGGSKDGTPDVARELGLEVLSQREERGKGVALRQSFSYFLDSGDDVLVMLDSDGSYDPADMPRLLHHLVEHDFDVVIGSRLRGRIEEGAMSRFNYIGNHILTWAAVALYRRFMSDVCTGYWAFTRAAISQMDLNSSGFEIEAEMYAACAHNDLRIGEVPILYRNRVGGTKLGGVPDGARILRKLLVRRFFPRPVNPVIPNGK